MIKSEPLKKFTIINNKYKIQEHISRGFITDTYKAINISNYKEYILKIIDFSEVDDWKSYELFEREIDILKNLDHPNIPKYIENFDFKDNGKNYFCLVQEYIQGENLYQIINEGKKFEFYEIKNILIKLLGILDYINNLEPGIIHRDINPKNVLMDKNNELYIVDFGSIGYVAKTTMTALMSKTFVGTIGYMPKEQLFGKTTPSSDIYSLGMTIVFLLTGKEPLDFHSDDEQKIYYKNYINTPGYFEKILIKMTEPNVDKRLKNVKETIELLKKKKNIANNESNYISENKLAYTVVLVFFITIAIIIIALIVKR